MDTVLAVTPASMAPHHRIVPSGFAFLDRRTGGFRLQKRYLFQAASGADRYILALQIAQAGVQNGEVVLLLTAEDPEAVLLQAERLEFPLARVLHGEQFLILAYDRRFGEKVSNPALQDYLLDDLRRKTNNRPINRVVLLDEPADVRPNPKVRQSLEAIDLALIEQHRAVLCYVLPTSEDGDGLMTRELQRTSFGWCAFQSGGDSGDSLGRFRILKEPALAEGSVLLHTRVEPGVGLVEVEPPSQAVPVVYIGEETRLVADLRLSLGGGFEVYRHPQALRLTDVVDSPSRPPIVVVEAMHGLRDVLGLVNEVRRRAPQAPIVVLSNQAGRGSDRVALLRHGADDLLSLDTPLAELRERIRRQAVRLGLVQAASSDLLRLDIGTDVPRTGDQGTVQWGVFKDHLEAQIASFHEVGGHVTLVAFAARAAGEDGPAINAVAARLARDLVAILRADDTCSMSPDGLLVARLYGVGNLELEKAIERLVERLRERLTHAPGSAELIVSTAVCPHDGSDADELYKQLLRPERRRYFPLKRAVTDPPLGQGAAKA